MPYGKRISSYKEIAIQIKTIKFKYDKLLVELKLKPRQVPQKIKIELDAEM